MLVFNLFIRIQFKIYKKNNFNKIHIKFLLSNKIHNKAIIEQLHLMKKLFNNNKEEFLNKDLKKSEESKDFNSKIKKLMTE
jgi:hypothetical protein